MDLPRLLTLLACAVWLMSCQPTAVSPSPTAAPSPIPPTPTTPPTASPTAEPPPTFPPPATLTPVAITQTDPTDPPPTSPPETPSPTHTPAPSPTAEPALNGVPHSNLLYLPDDVLGHMREVYALGQTNGRAPYRFSKLGDSVIANGDYLTRFDEPSAYDLGPYTAELQPVVEAFAGSWVRYGVGIRIGLSAWGVFDPMWADKEWCEPNETMIDCEIRLNNPSLVLIHLGTNDTNPTFERFLRQTVQHSLDNGIIPVLYTKADRFEETVYDEPNRNNEILRRVAQELRVPLIDFDNVAGTLPNRGLRDDNVHLNGPLQHDYNLPEVYEKGHTVHNLVTLLMLERLLNEVIEPTLAGEG